jgi:hypothetical protein
MTDHRFSEEGVMYRRALRIMSVLDARLLMIWESASLLQQPVAH